MRAFVDTSAFYALLDEGDRNHAAAATWWRKAACLAAAGDVSIENKDVVGDSTENLDNESIPHFMLSTT